jgi:uncharacterized membrane protein YphA (DoxX/SURF4 family)
MRYVALAGRILFSAIFIIAGFGHFTQARLCTPPSKACRSRPCWCLRLA